MTQTITIDPVTRIEGHSKITLTMGDNGRVENARFHVTQFRGFEKFTEGRMFHEMPAITARSCGICPVSHHLAAAKAMDAIVGVDEVVREPGLRDRGHWERKQCGDGAGATARLDGVQTCTPKRL